MNKLTLATLFLAATLSYPPPLLADHQAVVLARSGPDHAFSRGPVQARVAETVELTVALIDGRRVYSNAEQVRIGRRVTAPDGPLPPGTQVRWRRVEPHMIHRLLPPPNEGIATFSNNVLYGPDHGSWLGYDTLEYEARPLSGGHHVEIDDDVVRLGGARPTRPHLDRHGDAGSIWLAAELVLPDGTAIRTPDEDDVDRYGLSPDVLRVSFRQGDDFLAWLGTYFNVPNLFGSSGPSNARHQTERYVGADCADVLVGALRASGRTDVDYTSVSGIARLADSVSEVLVLGADGLVRDLAGEPVALSWGSDVLPGDLLALNYEEDPDDAMPRSWDHIGALVRDLGPGGAPNGVLDGEDLLRHMGYLGLVDEPIGMQGIIKMRIWRWSS